MPQGSSSNQPYSKEGSPIGRSSSYVAPSLEDGTSLKGSSIKTMPKSNNEQAELSKEKSNSSDEIFGINKKMLIIGGGIFLLLGIGTFIYFKVKSNK